MLAYILYYLTSTALGAILGLALFFFTQKQFLCQRVLNNFNRIIAARKPDFVIGAKYVLRWWVLQKRSLLCIYLHWMLHDDEDRALHDHRSFTISFILDEGYWEYVPSGNPLTWRKRGMPIKRIRRKKGDIVFRSPWALHRLTLDRDYWGEPVPSKSLFITLPHLRNWGFACPKKWVPWQTFTSPADIGQVGQGCGD